MKGDAGVLVREIMTKNVLTVKKDTSLAYAVKIMLENRISGLPVVDEDNHVVSMITKSDIVQLSLPSALRRTGSGDPSLIPRVESYLGKLREVALKDVGSTMTSREIICATPEMTVSEAAVIMYANEVRRLPVVNEGRRLVGIVSYSDIAAIIAADRAT